MLVHFVSIIYRNLLKIRHKNEQNFINDYKNVFNNEKFMEKNLYIDASHPNETRVVLKSDKNIEDYEYEGLKNKIKYE